MTISPLLKFLPAALLVSTVGGVLAGDPEPRSHSAVVATTSDDILTALAKRVEPDAEGAIGRNRKAYFHVRFQTGIHSLADVAVRNRDVAAADRFVRALEYSMKRRNATGGFELRIPDELAKQATPSRGDLASGDAFFLASAGFGAWALDQSDWFGKEAETADVRQRLDDLRPTLTAALAHLKGERTILKRYDAQAPNRLLFDALAYAALGRLSQDDEAVRIAGEFQAAALAQTDEDAGYFIERGGYDSSYNAVACALGYRLALLDPNDDVLRAALARAIAWQVSRIAASGEVSTEGNARVRPGGEDFLGREKDVAVGSVLEASLLAAAVENRANYAEAADRVHQFYVEKSKRR